MKSKRSYLLLLSALVIVAMPLAASAQGRRYGRNNDVRYLRPAVQRVDVKSGQLTVDIDRELDRSKFDGKNREDRINDIAHDFHEAAAQFRDRFDDGRDYNRAAAEARRVIDLGNRLERLIGRAKLSGRVRTRWSQIRVDLNAIRNAYS